MIHSSSPCLQAGWDFVPAISVKMSAQGYEVYLTTVHLHGLTDFRLLYIVIST